MNKVMNEYPTTQRESLTDLLGQIARNSAALVHDEIELVTRRIRDKVSTLRSGAVIMAIGAITAFAAFLFFCAALVLGLSSYMAPVMAALVSGVVFTIIGAAIIYIGYNKLKK